MRTNVERSLLAALFAAGATSAAIAQTPPQRATMSLNLPNFPVCARCDLRRTTVDALMPNARGQVVPRPLAATAPLPTTGAVSGRAALWLAAGPTPSDAMRDVRQEAAANLAFLRLQLWEVVLDGDNVALVYRGDSKTSADDRSAQMRAAVQLFLEHLRRIGELTGNAERARAQYTARLARITVRTDPSVAGAVVDAIVTDRAGAGPASGAARDTASAGVCKGLPTPSFPIVRTMRETPGATRGAPIRSWAWDVTREPGACAG
jgi:hypothetical protein